MTTTLPARLSASDFHRSVLALAPRVAVFDCDGTLWSGDAGHGFMLWSIETGLVSRNAADWIDSRYRLYRTGEISEVAICGEMVQLYTGLEETELRHAAATFFRGQIQSHIFPEMQRLIADLRAAGCEIWAVSSTNNWVIEEGVRDFGFPPERVLAARVEVAHGLITSTLLDVPTDEGKALALYRELLRCAEGHSVMLEECARQMVYAEELHAGEVDKMLRTSGEVAAFRPVRQSA